MKIRIIVLSLLMAAGPAWSHTRLETSAPKDKSRVTAPAKVELAFDDNVQLTALTLQRGDEKARNLKVPETWSYSFSVPLPTLAPGDYVVGWSVLSDDTHVASGKIHFTVVAGPVPAAKN